MAKVSAGQTAAVQVALRIRPLSERDRAQPRFANLAEDDVLRIHEKTVHVVPHNKLFTFDHVFGTDSKQSEIFAVLGEKLIHKFIDGYNVTILAYGQTSSGKTYTMGTAQHEGNRHNPEQEGIVPRAMALLFDTLQHPPTATDTAARPITPSPSISSSTDATTTTSMSRRLRPPSRMSATTSASSKQPTVHPPLPSKFTVKVSFVEIYNEELNDLLNSAPPPERPPITIREDAKGHIYWTGVKEVQVHSTEDVLFFLEQGTRNRATGATDMNEKSSRSHAIFSVALKHEKFVSSANPLTRATSPPPTRKQQRPGSALNMRPTESEGEWIVTQSKFHFVDLAGSERLKRTAAEGDRRKEGISINAGLLALGNVISALGDPSKRSTHIPYRDSKLTRLLQDSLGGSATTLMIACVSPVEYNLSETLNTLQYANRARNIKNRIEKNEVEEWVTTDNIELLRSMVGKLRAELRTLKAGSVSSSATLVNPSHPTSQDADIARGTSPVSSAADLDHVFQEQRLTIADLQRQVEELDGEVSVTRERNRIVEAELKRLRKMEQMRQKQDTINNNLDFQHLVEPVIEEYEKSIASLESQLAMARAALNHSNLGIEEHQTKLQHHERIMENQDKAMLALQSRLSKLLEREQSNEAYIEELEGKLLRSAADAARDQELLNDLKTRISKLKETDENTEQYIANLEERLAASDSEKHRLLNSIEELEIKLAEKERANEKLRRQWTETQSTDTQKMMLKELDERIAKQEQAERERDEYKKALDRLTAEQQSTDTLSNNNNNDTTTVRELHATAETLPSRLRDGAPTSYTRRYAEEKETPESAAALAVQHAEKRAAEEADRARRLQEEIEKLRIDHQETLKELDEVLVRYQEALDQVDHLQRPASPSNLDHDTFHPEQHTLTSDLDKEMTRAKEEERETHLAHMAKLEARVDQLEHQIEQYQEQLEDANNKLNNALRENASIVSTHQQRLENWQQDKAQAEQHAQTALKRISELEELLELERHRVEELEELQAQTVSQLAISTPPLQSPPQANQELKQEDQTAKATTHINGDKNTHEIELSSLQVAVDEAKAREEQLKGELEVHIQTVAKQKSQLEMLLSDKNKAEDEMAALQAQLATMTYNLERLTADHSTAVAAHTRELEEIQAQKRRVETVLSEKDSRIEALSKDLETLTQTLETNQLSQQKAQAEIEEQQRMIQTLRGQCDTLTGKLERQSAEMTQVSKNDSETSVQTVQAELEQRLADARLEHETLEKSLQQLQQSHQQHVEDAARAKEMALQQQSDLEKQLQQAQDNVARTREELERTKRELQQAQDNVTHNREELERSKHELQQAQDDMIRTREELEQTKRELARNLESLLEARQDLEQTSAELLNLATSFDSERAQLEETILRLEQDQEQLLEEMEQQAESHKQALEKAEAAHAEALALVATKHQMVQQERNLPAQQTLATPPPDAQAELAAQLAQALADKQTLEDAIQDYKASLDAAQNEKQQSLDRLLTLEQQLDHHTKSAIQEQDKLAHLQQALEDAESKRAALEKDMLAHQAESNLSEKVTQLQAQLSKQATDLALEHGQRQELENELEITKQQLQTTTQEKKQALAQITETQTTLQRLTDELKAAHQSERQELENALETTKQQLQAATREKEQVLAQITETQTTLQRLTDQLEAAHQDQHTLAQQLAAAKREREERDQQLGDVEQQLARVIQENKEQHASLTEQMTRDHTEAVQRQQQEHLQEVRLLSDSLTDARAMTSELKETLLQKERELANSSTQMNQLRQEHEKALATAQESIEALEREVDALERKVMTLENELQSANASVEEKDRHLRALRGQVESLGRTIQALQDEAARGEFNAQLAQADNASDVTALYVKRIAELEEKTKRYAEENLEYVTLSEEFEQEVRRLTEAMERVNQALAESEHQVEERDNKLASLNASQRQLLEERDSLRSEAQQLVSAQEKIRLLEANEARLSREQAEWQDFVTKQKAGFLQQIQELQSEIATLKAANTPAEPSPTEVMAETEPALETNTRAKRASATPPTPQVSTPAPAAPAAPDASKTQALQKELDALVKAQTAKEAAWNNNRQQLEKQVQESRQLAEQEITELQAQLASLRDSASQEKRSLEAELATEKKAKDKLMRDMTALEAQVEEMLSKKSKFMCF